MADSIVWFDIPAKDLDRAVEFYGAVLGCKIETASYPGVKLAFLPGDRGGRHNRRSGCIYIHVPYDRDAKLLAEVEMTAPKVSYGPVIYLNCDGRLDEAIARVEQLGGKILRPKESMGDFGSRVVILDCEGNRVALHST